MRVSAGSTVPLLSSPGGPGDGAPEENRSPGDGGILGEGGPGEHGSPWKSVSGRRGCGQSGVTSGDHGSRPKADSKAEPTGGEWQRRSGELSSAPWAAAVAGLDASSGHIRRAASCSQCTSVDNASWPPRSLLVWVRAMQSTS